jgi:hypothetical protein
LSETKRQLGEIGNPAVFAEARRLFPGYPVSEVLMDDAAKLSGLVRFVKATPALVKMGLSQLASEERIAARAANDRRDLDRIKAKHPGHVPQPTQE